MRNWLKKDLKYVWHPYTQMKDCETLPPLFIKRAKGIKLYDNKGKFYYDTISSWWCNIHGHNHPGIKAAIKRQLDLVEHVLFAGITHEPGIRLAEKLISIAPDNLTRVFFSDNGSTSVETALKMSFQYWKNTGKKSKNKFVSLDRGYHGDTIGAMSVSGRSLFNELFSTLFFPSFKIPSPYCYRCPSGKERASCRIDCIKPLEKLLEKKAGVVSAVILEPLVMAAGGMIIYPKEYLKKAAALAKKYNVHLIVDEVATGFGRTGRIFASDHARVRPDFMCLSKGITSGYLPLAATLTTDKIYSAFYDDYGKKKTFYHGHTYTANPVACAAAVASIEILQKRDRAGTEKIISIFNNKLKKFKNLAPVGDVRSIGMIGAIELVKDKKLKTPFNPDDRVGFEIYKKGLAKNLLLRPLGDVIYFFLPLCVTEREITRILHDTYGVIDKSMLL